MFAMNEKNIHRIDVAKQLVLIHVSSQMHRWPAASGRYSPILYSSQKNQFDFS